MKLYQKLISDSCKEIGYNKLAREIGVPSTSVHEWATMPHKAPHFKSLAKIAEYYQVPLPYLLMETDFHRTLDEQIMAAVLNLSHHQKQELLQQISTL